MTTPLLLSSSSARTAASMMQLPPSPEFGPLASGSGSAPLDFSLEDNILQESRFRSVARFTSFAPQTMACSGRRAALAGPHGIVLLDTHQPHKPCLILRHEVSFQEEIWTALQFQKQSPEHQYLAAARGSGVLVWDVSGNSLSPLLGRLGHVHTGTSETTEQYRIMDLSWKPESSNMLTTCTSTSASIWDVRMPTRPTMRFGTRTSLQNSTLAYVQISCNSRDQVALLDSGGTIRVHDPRMARSNNSNNSGAMSTFSAHGYAGVGLSYMPSISSDDSSEGYWITWGLEDETHEEKAAVKLWEPCSEPASPSTTDADSYWFMDGSSERSPLSARHLLNTSKSSSVGGYRLVAQQSFEKGLACTRICPDPLQEGIVTVRYKNDAANEESLSWQADLWKLEKGGNDDSLESQEDEDFGLVNKASFGIGKDDRLLQTALGRFSNKSDNSIGSIRGAELAFLKQPKAEDELILVCLTNQGLVTSHAIPEAAELSPLDTKKEQEGHQSVLSPNKASPTRRTLQMVRVAGAADAVTPPLFRGIYPTDTGGVAGVTSDPALALNKWANNGDATSAGAAAAFVNAWESTISEAPTSPQQQQQQTMVVTTPYPPQDDPITSISRGVEGGMMQFDMDVGYGTALPESQSLQTTLSSEESPMHSPKQRIGDSTPVVVHQAQADKVPCPPLCGAVFGRHGLVSFHNGEVRKMWSWYYQQSDTAVAVKRRQQQPAAAAITPQTLFSAATSVEMDGTVVQQEELETELGNKSIAEANRTSPRTLEDLINMTTAAKEAQWGGDNDESSGDLDSGSDSYILDIFDDNSFSESNSSDSEDLDYLITEKKAGKNDMYGSYFGDLQRPVAAPSSPGKSGENVAFSPHSSVATFTSGSGSRKDRNSKVVGGPSSDQLAPIVQVTHAYDGLVLNGQCPELAEGWSLGDLNFVSIGLSKDSLSVSSEHAYESGESDWASHHSGKNYLANFQKLSKAASFTGQERFPTQAIGQVLSDTALEEKVGKKQEPGETERMGDITVRGGERSLRPNRKESMVFLRKLFTYQKGGSGSPTMFSPPDAPMLPKSLTSSNSMKRSKSSNAILQTYRVGISGAIVMEETKEEMEVVPSMPRRKFGVYTRSVSFRGNQMVGVQNKLFRTMQICLGNANVCNELRQPDKAHVWSLLAQMVDNVLNDDFDAFNGWSSGGALGQELVANILRHYELQGDVQMLATIVCVLGGKFPVPSLLPNLEVEKYDSYIRGYSGLLYGWGLLTIRAEVNKHLVRKPPGSEGEQLVPIGDALDNKKTPGIAFVPLCIRCRREAQPETNVCSSCQDYAFCCAICTNAVRGLFTVCILCGHGGHVNHIVPWFEKHTACPTGCGCICLVWPSLPSQQQLEDRRSLLLVQSKPSLQSVAAPDSLTESGMLDSGATPFDGFR